MARRDTVRGLTRSPGLELSPAAGAHRPARGYLPGIQRREPADVAAHRRAAAPQLKVPQPTGSPGRSRRPSRRRYRLTRCRHRTRRRPARRSRRACPSPIPTATCPSTRRACRGPSRAGAAPGQARPFVCSSRSTVFVVRKDRRDFAGPSRSCRGSCNPAFRPPLAIPDELGVFGCDCVHPISGITPLR